MGSLRELIFKPKWQHKSAEIRQRAVALENEPRLLEALPEIARNDPAPEVRMAAVRRLVDLLHLMRIASDDDHDEVRATAFRIYRTLLSGEHDQAPHLDERLEIIPRLEDADLIEYLAVQGTDVAIRRAAIVHIEQPGKLARIAQDEPDRTLRLTIIERIAQPGTLARLAEVFRTADKRAHKAALKRAHELEGRSDEDSGADAETLCRELESLSRSGDPKAKKAEALALIETRWAALPDRARAALEVRFSGAHRIMVGLFAAPAETTSATPEHKALELEIDGVLADAGHLGDQSTLGAIQMIEDRLTSLATAASEHRLEQASDLVQASADLAQLHQQVLAQQPVDERLTRLCKNAEDLAEKRADARALARLRERWDTAWNARHATMHDDAVKQRFMARLDVLDEALARQQARRATALESIEGQMEKLEAALESGNLAESVVAKQAVLDTLARIGPHPSVDEVEFKGRVAAARGRLRELRDWQHWANNKVRTTLCEDAEALVGAGLHPDALTARLKELRAQWKDLDDGEQLPGDPPRRNPAPGLFRRFQAACNKAFEPAKGFFEKRAEYREGHLETLQALADRIEQAASKDIEDVKAAERLVRDGRRSLRELSEIPPKYRSKMARRLREAANALDQRLGDAFDIVARRKQRIIDEVTALDPEADLDAAINGAKDAQRRWKEAGHLRRSQEQALWKQFREQCDRIFGKVTERNEAEQAQVRSQLDQLERIIEAAAALEATVADDPDGAEAALRNLHGEWRTVGASQRGRERQFLEISDRIEREIADSRQAKRKTDRAQILSFVARCHAAEARWFGEDVEAAVLEGEPPETLPPALVERWQNAVGDAPADLAERAAQAEADADALCIALEFLAGIESPAQSSQARMDYQVARLSKHMSGEAQAPRESELESLLEQWAACGPLSPQAADAFRTRVDQALEAF